MEYVPVLGKIIFIWPKILNYSNINLKINFRNINGKYEDEDKENKQKPDCNF